MMMHGENDNDVPIAEAEQFYVALHDVGTEAVMVRYPREGHGIRESKHVVDFIDRSIRWYESIFRRPRRARSIGGDGRRWRSCLARGAGAGGAGGDRCRGGGRRAVVGPDDAAAGDDGEAALGRPARAQRSTGSARRRSTAA